MVARLSGAGRLRFVVQPMVEIFLGVRDGANDAREKIPTFLWALAFHEQHRRRMLANAMSSAGDLIAIAILMDLISQFLIFREIRPGAALLVGPGADLRTVCRSKNLWESNLTEPWRSPTRVIRPGFKTLTRPSFRGAHGRGYTTPQVSRGMDKCFIQDPAGAKRDKTLPQQREVVQLLAKAGL